MKKQNSQNTVSNKKQIQAKVRIFFILGAIISLVMAAVTSYFGFFIGLFFIFLVSTILLIERSSNQEDGEEFEHKNWTKDYLKNPLDPRNPFNRAKK